MLYINIVYTDIRDEFYDRSRIILNFARATHFHDNVGTVQVFRLSIKWHGLFRRVVHHARNKFYRASCVTLFYGINISRPLGIARHISMKSASELRRSRFLLMQHPDEILSSTLSSPSCIGVVVVSRKRRSSPAGCAGRETQRR